MLNQKKKTNFNWHFGPIPLAKDKIHEKVFRLLIKETRGKVLNITTRTGAMAERLKKIGFEVYCCDINPEFFSIPDISIDIGYINKTLPYPDNFFDHIVCPKGIEHTENPFNAIREFSRVLKPNGKLYFSLPNYFNIERRLKFLFIGMFSKIPSPKKLGKELFDNLWMLHLTPLTFPILRLILEYYVFQLIFITIDKKKKRMRFLLPLVLVIKFSVFWSDEKREDYYLKETLSQDIIMGGNTLILIAKNENK